MHALLSLFLGILIFAAPTISVACSAKPRTLSENRTPPGIFRPDDNNQNEILTSASTIRIYSYRVINTYKHDADAFTQGLVIDNGILYESTGLKGRSSLRKVDLETGRILLMHVLDAKYFGEGITVFGDNVIQLTWQEYKGFVYDKNTLEVKQEFDIGTEGWGITTDGKNLIMSDGTAILQILSATTFKNIGHILVQDANGPVANLNELEYVGGLIYANIWNSDNIAIINPADGRVNAWVVLEGLLPEPRDGKPVDVLNGIAYDAQKARLFVTGKLWPSIFEIKLVRKE